MNLEKETVKATVTLSLTRVKDRSQVGSASGQARKDSPSIRSRFGGTAGDPARIRLAKEAAKEAVERALKELTRETAHVARQDAARINR